MQLLLIAKYKISIIKMLVIIGTDIEIRVKKIQNSLNSIKKKHQEADINENIFLFSWV